jgi:hypothetical protein
LGGSRRDDFSVIAVNDDLLRHIEAGDYVATLEPTRQLSEAALDGLYERTLSACLEHVNIGVTLKLVQHVRANLEHYVAYFAARPRVTYFCTDHVEDAIRIRLFLARLGHHHKILLLYACAPECAYLYVQLLRVGTWDIGATSSQADSGSRCWKARG